MRTWGRSRWRSWGEAETRGRISDGRVPMTDDPNRRLPEVFDHRDSPIGTQMVAPARPGHTGRPLGIARSPVGGLGPLRSGRGRPLAPRPGPPDSRTPARWPHRPLGPDKTSRNHRKPLIPKGVAKIDGGFVMAYEFRGRVDLLHQGHIQECALPAVQIFLLTMHPSHRNYRRHRPHGPRARTAGFGRFAASWASVGRSRAMLLPRSMER